MHAGIYSMFKMHVGVWVWIILPQTSTTCVLTWIRTRSAQEYGSIKRWQAADWGWVGVWACDGVPPSLWEQPGWARQAWMHDAGSHLALDGTPEGDTGWCQPSENTSSMFENENDMFIYTVTLCGSGNCAPAELRHIHKYYMFYICWLFAGCVFRGTAVSSNLKS